MEDIQLTKIHDRASYLEYLLLADENETIVQAYMEEGEMYAISYKETLAGVILFLFPDHRTIEIKNIAIDPSSRGKGIGKKTIHSAVQMFKHHGYQQMIVGTSNSSIENLAFYQKAGFRFHAIKQGFFLDYPVPFFENGIRGMDMIIFKKNLED